MVARKKRPKSHRTVLRKHRLKNLQNLKTAVTTLKKRKMTLHKIYFKRSKSPIGDLDLFHCSSFNFLFIRLRPSLIIQERTCLTFRRSRKTVVPSEENQLVKIGRYTS